MPALACAAAFPSRLLLVDTAEREAAAEMLLEAKGFTDVVVSITDNAADVVLNMGDITDAKRKINPAAAFKCRKQALLHRSCIPV